MTNNVVKFDYAEGSKHDDSHKPIYAIDVYNDTVFSSNVATPFLDCLFSKDIFNLVALDIAFYEGKKRAATFTLSYCNNETKEKGDKDEKNGKLPKGYVAIGGYTASGTTNDFQRFVFPKPIKANTIRITLDSNSDGDKCLSITSVRAISSKDVPVVVPPAPTPTPTPVEPTPQPPDVVNDNEIQLVYPAKKGGQVVKKFATKRSNHNHGDRDSFYSDPKNYFKAANAQIGAYLKTKLSKSDQGSIKILSGSHGNDNRNAGNCYAVGLQFNVGKNTEGHLAKEIKHPNTPKFPEKIKYLGKNKELPDLNDKTVGYRLVYYVTPNKTLKGRLDLDLSVLDKNPEELKTCPNNWTPYFEFEDDGSWEDEPYLENQGVKYNDIAMGMYIRFDKVTYETKYNFLQCIEIEPPAVAKP